MIGKGSRVGSKRRARPSAAVPRRAGRGGDRLDGTPCQVDPVKWDLDAAGRDDGFLADWHHAIAACGSCPALEPCRALLAEYYPEHGATRSADNPSGVIWAGVAYGDKGAPLNNRQLVARHHLLSARATEGAA